VKRPEAVRRVGDSNSRLEIERACGRQLFCIFATRFRLQQAHASTNQALKKWLHTSKSKYSQQYLNAFFGATEKFLLCLMTS
jgi:hypothetical protein